MKSRGGEVNGPDVAEGVVGERGGMSGVKGEVAEEGNKPVMTKTQVGSAQPTMVEGNAGGFAAVVGSTRAIKGSTNSGKFDGGNLMLFFGARTKEELPYFGPLQSLPKDFIDINFAFSRTPGQPKRYVQDVMRERASDLAPLLADPNAYFYVCGLKAMEAGVVLALREIALEAGLDWDAIADTLKHNGRLHLETY